GVGREPPLFGDVRLQPCQHRVEGVREFAELVAAARQPDAVGERSGRGQAGRVGDAGQRGEHPPGEQPPAHGANTCSRLDRTGKTPWGEVSEFTRSARSGTYRSRNTHTAASSRTPAS